MITNNIFEIEKEYSDLEIEKRDNDLYLCLSDNHESLSILLTEKERNRLKLFLNMNKTKSTLSKLLDDIEYANDEGLNQLSYTVYKFQDNPNLKKELEALGFDIEIRGIEFIIKWDY